MCDKFNPKANPSNSGIALVSVLFIAAAVLILALTFSRVIVSETQAVTSSKRINASLQVSDGVSERARAKIVNEYQTSYLTIDNFMQSLESKSPKALTFQASTNNDPHTYTETMGEHTGRWQVTLPKKDANGKWLGDWVEISATAETSQGVQTVIRRVGLGSSNIFELAMLSKETDCMYCHLRVRGDVGQLDFMRPGWGHETVHATEDKKEQKSGVGSGGSRGGSIVYGTAYAAKEISGDASTPDGGFERVNGAKFEKVITNYTGDKLPKDKDGKPDFPAIKTEVAIENANGSISGGENLWLGDDFEGFDTTNATIKSKNQGAEGNAVLVGTKDNPIVLSDDVYFSGDVIIKGYVKGRGGIYAGRNIYIAGDVKYVDENTDCWRDNVSDPNACAAADISAGKDELRLGARGNIVVGDYTEQKAGKDKTWDEQQASDFFKSQFGFDSKTTKYYQKGTGDELECSGSGAAQQCENADGKQIANTDVVAKQGDEAYNYSLRPGSVDSSGNFEGWLSDDQYQEILGGEKRTYNTWRKDVKRADLDGDDATEEDDLVKLKEQFGHYQFGTDENPDRISDESLRALLCKTTCDSTKDERIDLKTESGKVVGLVHWDKEDDTMRVVIDPPQVYQKQVARIDAFLYANQRIAGKTFMSQMVVNGGLIAKEIGILAPGIKRSWFMPKEWPGPGQRDRYGFLDKINCTDPDSSKTLYGRGVAAVSPDAAVDDDAIQASGAHIPYDADSDDCALTINYDYRLRNGGFGYNLVAANVGQTTGWKIADKRSQHVREP